MPALRVHAFQHAAATASSCQSVLSCAHVSMRMRMRRPLFAAINAPVADALLT